MYLVSVLLVCSSRVYYGCNYFTNNTVICSVVILVSVLLAYYLKQFIMARAIKNTPVLLGTDAKKIKEQIAKVDRLAVSKDVKERIKSNYNLINSLVRS